MSEQDQEYINRLAEETGADPVYIESLFHAHGEAAKAREARNEAEKKLLRAEVKIELLEKEVEVWRERYFSTFGVKT